ncbi:DNRLRE domain-containing protein [Streptomyces erythrochromogenes]|uniref:DNRLRE domain-containing protein n=1 Tax=Streptomyces erythrochromogenes TaxID=285574 RepID=UPI0036C50406
MTVSTIYGAEAAIAAPAPGADKAKQAPQTAQSAADIPSARVAARLYKHRVEALSERSETSTTYVNQDGSLTTEIAAGPIRFKDPATGQWRDVDVNLAAGPDGSVASKAHPQGLRLSGKTASKVPFLKSAPPAGDTTAAADLVTLGTGDEAITLQWRGGLPAPKLDGTKATYEGAVPGADLIVEATRTGFEQFVELKAKPEAGFGYTLPLKTMGLKVEQQPDGSVLFTDKKSQKTATMPAPVMWDATVDAASGEHTRRAKVGMKVVKTKDGVDLVITPDAAFLADPATKYPVTVDPSTSSLGNLFDTYVQQGETVDWSNDTELDLGNPGTKNGDGTWRTARSFITWNTAPVADALISDAKLSLWNFHSGNTDCTAQPWEVWTANNASTASRWTNQPAMVTKMATSTETKGNPGCATQPDGWINADVTSLVQHWSNNKWAVSGMGLRATDENNIKQWKRVNSSNAASNVPKLTVTYNYRPRTGTKQEAGPPFFSYGGAYTVNTLTPTLRDTFVDANGDQVNGTFQIFDSATNTQVGNVIVSPFVASGEAASVTVPAGVLTNGKTYKFRSNPYDGTHYNLGWSAWKTFTVDTTAPSAPTGLTSTDYPSNAWVKSAGQAGNFTVSPPAGTDHQWLEWSLDAAEWTRVPTDGAAGTRTLSVTPPSNGTHTLHVRTVDKADNESEAVEYEFHAGPGGFVQPEDGERTARRLPLTAEADGAAFNAASFSWRRSEADPWVQIPPGHVTNGGTPLTAWPVSMTSGRTPALVWNTTDTVDPDGSVQIKADFTGPASATGATQPLAVVVDRNASGAATSPVGPGTLNLLTGDYEVSATDVSAFGMSVSRTTSSRDPHKGIKQEGQAAIFGQEWASGTAAELVQSDYSHVARVSDTAVDAVTTSGDALHFTANAARTGWVSEPGAGSITLTGSLSGSFTLTDDGGTVTEFTRGDPAMTTWQVSSTLVSGVENSTTTVVSETVTVDTKKLARPKRVIAPTSAVTTSVCATTPQTKGCRSLEFVYATATTATGYSTSADFGDFAGQVKEIRLWSTEPGAANATSKAVSTYRYDAGGNLRQQWDPNLAQSTQAQYAYNAADRIDWLQTKSELPWSFTYGQAGSSPTAGDGMLLKASRAGLKPGTAGEEQGTSATSVVYGVPLTGGAAPYPMGTADVKAWGQTSAPTDATALFPADAVPSSHSGSALAASAYTRASVTYLGASGRPVNSASPGGHITTTEYDRYGNTVRELSAANRALALGTSPADQAAQANLGIGQLTSAERAHQLSTATMFDAAGVRELGKLGPLRRVDLTADLKNGETLLVPTGTSVTARDRSILEYDAGRPTNGTARVKDQVTKATVGAQVREHPTVLGEPRATETVYDWLRGLPIRTVRDPGGLAITETTEYDAKNRVSKQLLHGSNGSDASTRVTTYWSATGTGTCQGRPEWADLVCTVGPAGDITGGGSNPTKLATTTTEYNWWGSPAKRIETVNGSTRTTTTEFDAAGRTTKVTTTGGTGTAAPESTTEYDAVTGRAVKNTSPTGGTIVKQFDKLGRTISYTDADGGVTTTEYDLLDRPTKITDNVPSTVTFTYDHAAEPRGLPTKTTDSVAGEFRPSFDAAGAVRSEKLPGGYTLNISTDPGGDATKRSYVRDSDSAVVYSDTVNESVHGQITTHSGISDQRFRYDTAGRLASVEDTADTVCTRRTYAFDGRSNRTGLTTAAGTPGADCPATGGTTTTHTYDSADRLVDSGYAYDEFGRTTTVPGHGTVAYYNSDRTRQQTLSNQRQTWGLDAAQRYRGWTKESYNGSVWTQTASRVNHYSDDTDNPRWIVEDTATGAVTRNVASAGGLTTTSKTGDVVLHLTTIQGSVAMQLPLTASQPPLVLDTDEYGKPRAGQASARYGWLGGHQRSSETPSGLTLMGARLYNPSTGRFLSADPVYGGSANAYEYANADPVNQQDLDGRISKSWRKKIIEANACRSLGWRGCALASAISGMLLATFRKGRVNNAIRHFMWQTSLTFFFGARAAKRLGDAHEWGESGDDTKIDQHNNSVARSFAVRNWWSMLRWYYSGTFWWNLYYYALVYIDRRILKTSWS